jgi:hypothetical protein
MDQVDQNSTRRRAPWARLAIATVIGASAVTIAVPATSNADPETPTPVTPTAPPPVNPNPPPPPPVDPNAGRIGNAVGGFSFVLPPGWVESDASHLDYGSELLSKATGPAAWPGQPPPVANDTRIVMGRLDQKLYASAEANDSKAAVRLGSDMGEFFMPYPGTRINQETTPLAGANGITGSASYYEVKFSDASKPNGQIWTGVIGSSTASPPQRWFVVWLGTANNPVDDGGAKALAESIQPWTAAPATAPAPGAPGAPPPGAPAPAAPGPAPAAPAPPPGAAAPAPPPGQAPAGEATPSPTPTPQQTLPA